MEFYEVIAKRRSVRSYKPDPIPNQVFERVIGAALAAPSWKNQQCWRFIVIKDADSVKNVGAVLDGNRCAGAFENAPAAILIAAEPSDSGRLEGKDYYLVDCGVAMEHLVLAATAEGLGTCWVGLFNETPFHNLLGIPGDVRVVAITPIGYPSDDLPPQPGRRAAEKSVFDAGWRIC